MISILIVLVTIITASTYAFLSKDKMFIQNKHSKSFNIFWTFPIIAIVLIGSGITMFQPYKLERVDSGHKGLKVNLTGNDRGVSNYQYKTGWVLYNSWISQMLEFPTYQQHIEYEPQEVITKGGFSATIKPSFNYSLREDMIKNKQFSKLYDQIEKAYKDGKITKIQYDKNMEKLLKDFSD